MSQIVILNERSYPNGPRQPESCRTTIEQFLSMMLALRRLMPELALVTQDPLPNVPLGDGYTIWNWMVDPSTRRELRQFAISLGQRAPFRIAKELFGDPDPGVTEYEFDGAPFDGLVIEGIGLAHLYRGLAVSFSDDPRWRLTQVPLRYRCYTDQGDERGTSSTPHAALAPQISYHGTWLRDCVKRTIGNAPDLWARRGALFPRLEFAPGVEACLELLEVKAFLQVVGWLFEMNDALVAWPPSAPGATPTYPPHCTDESHGRKRLCWFVDQDGGSRLFSWHGRYTPGAGRIHFRLDTHSRKVVIGYIGPKLGI